MKLKLIMGLIGVLSLSSFSTLPSSDDTDKKPQESWVARSYVLRGLTLYWYHNPPLSIARCEKNR